MQRSKVEMEGKKCVWVCGCVCVCGGGGGGGVDERLTLSSSSCSCLQRVSSFSKSRVALEGVEWAILRGESSSLRASNVYIHRSECIPAHIHATQCAPSLVQNHESNIYRKLKHPERNSLMATHHYHVRDRTSTASPTARCTGVS